MNFEATNGRCDHGMIPGWCAMCSGQVTGKNQTQSFEEEERPASTRKPRAVKAKRVIPDAIKAKVEKLRRLRRIKVMEPAGEKTCKGKGPTCEGTIVAQGFGANRCYRWQRGSLPGDWPPFSLIRPIKKKKAGMATPVKRTRKKPGNGVPKIPDLPVLASDAKDVCVIDFRAYPEVLAALKEQAHVHIRSIEEQALYYIVKTLKGMAKPDGDPVSETSQPVA